MKKRLLSLVMALAMICGFAAWVPELSIGSEIKAGAYTAHTREEALNWIRSQVGKSIEWTDASNLYQCVDFVQAYYAYLGVQPYIHNAGNYSWADDAVPSGWQRIKGAQPQPGDILIYTNSGAGHVGLYESDYCHYHQNLRYSDGYHRYVEKITWKYNGFNDPYWGVIRPFNSEGHVMSENEGAGRTIPDGDYWIFSGVAQNDYLDIPGVDSPASSGTSLIVTEATQMPSKVDTWTVTYLNNGFYKITQNGEPVAMEVPDASLDHNSQVKTYVDNESIAQQWSIKETDNGYTIQSRANGFYLDLDGFVTGPSGKVLTHEFNGGSNQLWCFVPFDLDERPIPDGEYAIKSGLGETWLDVYGTFHTEPYKNGQNVDIYSAVVDTFDVQYYGDGYYRILEHNSGLALDVDGSSYLKKCGNVALYENYQNDSRNQLWRIRDEGNGYYTLISKMSGYCLDVAGASTDDLTNVQQHPYNWSYSQKWRFESVQLGHELSEDEAGGRTIPDGDYWIVSELGINAYLDIQGAEYPAKSASQISTWDGNGKLPDEKVDAWTVTYLNNGFYSITQNGVEVAMEVANGSLEHNTRIHTYECNGTVGQQWSIVRTNHGYRIQSRANGYYLDFFGDKVGDGYTITHEHKDYANQLWSFVPFYSDDRPVKDGEYNIKSAAGNAYLDAEGSSYSGGTNIRVDSTVSDAFVLKYIDNGYYTLSEKTTGLYVSVADTGDSEYLKVNKNIQLTDYSEPCRNNLWRLVDKGDNQYCLISKYNGYYLDLAEMSTVAGTTAQSVQYNSSDTQKWMFVNPHTHSYTSKVTKKATCTEPGIRTYTCTCGESYTKTIKALGHDYIDTVVAPTCTAKGYTNHKCSRCGDEYNDTETDMIAHKFGKWTVTTKPTCTAKGIETRTCSVCKAKETRKTSALGHDYIESIIPSTCQSKGYTLHKCLRCNDEYKDNETNMAAHSFGKWTTTVKPTCTAKGSETRICSVCKVSETREIKALGHDYVASLVSANCNSKGYTLYKCSRCNDEFKDNYTEPTGNHKWSEWKTTAFDVNKGTSTQTRTCSACNKAETKTTKNAIQRLAGAGRYATAVEISKAGFPDGSDTAVLAYGLNYADALAGVSLATKMKAPILLTNTKTLDATTLAEIKRLKAKNVIILGGTGAISDQVKKELENNGLTTERIAGASRFGTATAIAEKLNDAPTDVFFAYYDGFADALSVSPIAAIKNAPVLYLTKNGELNADTAAYLAKLKKAGSVKNAYVIGGEGVISNDMATKAAKALGLSKATRVAGADRFATCVAVNEKFADVLDGDSICVATGMDFPDALAGGVYAALNKAPLFLINGKAKTPQLSDEQKAYLKTKAAGKITAFGGVGVVPDSHIEDIAKNSV